MNRQVITLNAGSSSIKFAAFRRDGGDGLRLAASGQIEGLGASPEGRVKDAAGDVKTLTFDPVAGPGHDAAMGAIIGWLRGAGFGDSVAAVGHRIVHGGPDLIDPMRLDSAAIEAHR